MHASILVPICMTTFTVTAGPCAVDWLLILFTTLLMHKRRLIHSLVTLARMASQMSKDKLNRLATEKSPYLLQHSTNPVDWYDIKIASNTDF